MFARTLFSALAFALSVSAVPTSVVPSTTVPSAVPTVPAGKPTIHELEVYNPAVKSPAEGDVWNVGETKTVTWDSSVIPQDGKNHTGLLLLGYVEDGSSNEHLDIKNPLAWNFPLEAGQVDVTVPDVPTREDYVVVLFGDSGNTSHKFKISGGDASATPAPSGVDTSVPADASPLPTDASSSLPSAPSA